MKKISLFIFMLLVFSVSVSSQVQCNNHDEDLFDVTPNGTTYGNEGDLIGGVAQGFGWDRLNLGNYNISASRTAVNGSFVLSPTDAISSRVGFTFNQSIINGSLCATLHANSTSTFATLSLGQGTNPFSGARIDCGISTGQDATFFSCSPSGGGCFGDLATNVTLPATNTDVRLCYDWDGIEIIFSVDGVSALSDATCAVNHESAGISINNAIGEAWENIKAGEGDFGESGLQNECITSAVSAPPLTVIINSPLTDTFSNEDVIDFNITASLDTNVCKLFTNESGSFVSINETSGELANIPFILSHDVTNNQTADIEYFVQCNNTNGSQIVNSSFLEIHYDDINPSNTFIVPSIDNTTQIFGVISLNILVVNTNLLNVTWNITNSSNELVFSNQNLSINGTTFTIDDIVDLSNNGSQTYTIDVTSCDQNNCKTDQAQFSILQSGIIFVNYTTPTDFTNIETSIVVNSTNLTFVNWFCKNQTTNQTTLLITDSGFNGVQTLNVTIPSDCLLTNTIEFSGNCSGTNSFCEFFEEKLLITTLQTTTSLSVLEIALISLIPLLIIVLTIRFIMKKQSRSKR